MRGRAAKGNTQRQAWPIGLIIVAALLVASCGEGRRPQCARLGEANDRVRRQIIAVQQDRIGQPAYAPEFPQRLAPIYLQGAQTIAATEVSDRRLQELRERLATAYRNSSQVYQQLATLYTTTNPNNPNFESQSEALRSQIDADVPATLHELRIYCIGG